MPVRLAALLLTALTGFSGLVYEVVWQRYLSTLLGSHSEATAAVLGIFLGGLAAGYSLFGVVTRRRVAAAALADRPPQMLRAYGFVEAGIGLFALAFPWLFRGALVASSRLALGVGPSGFAVDVLLTALLIGPPTILMGGTIPMLSQALASTLADATRLHALVYAFNTTGAFVGALTAGFFLVPWFGLDAVVCAMGAINLIAGISFVLLERGDRSPAGFATTPESSRTVAGFYWFGAAALLAGFAMMSIQTVLIRLGALALGSSQFTFSMVVAVFVLCIALGSSAVSLFRRIPTGTVVVAQGLLAVLLLALYPSLEDLPFFAHRVRVLFQIHTHAFYPYHAMLFALLLVLLAVPVALSGALLPLLFHELRREMGQLGAVAGRLYAWNTVGSLLGALTGGYLLLFWLDLHHVYRIAAVSIAAGAVLLGVRLLSFPGAATCGVGFVLAGLVASQLSPWNARRLTSGLFRERNEAAEEANGPDAFFKGFHPSWRLIHFDDDPTSTVSVVEFATDISSTGFGRAIFTNGKPDSSVPRELRTVVSLALLPCVLAERCERAFVVGLGTGVTAGELTTLEGMNEVVAAEISSGVIDALPLFEFANHALARSSKLEIRRSDAYRALMRDDSHYDVIVSEPSNPWVTGVENLYSVEFLSAAKQRLSPGGVYAQWLQSYEISPETFQIALRTFSSVFDHVSVWFAQDLDLILVGSNGDPAGLLDVARIERRATLDSYAVALRRAGYGSVPELLARELLPLEVARAGVSDGPLQSLFKPILNHAATRDFFVNAEVTLRVSPERNESALATDNSLLRRWVELRGGRVGEAEFGRLVNDLCGEQPRDCLTFVAWWAHRHPDSEAVARWMAGNPASEDEIVRIRLLFGDGELPAKLEPAVVRDLARAYEEHFHPAAPFRRSVLDTALRRCEDGGDGSCASTRETVEEAFGPLSTAEASH